MAPGPVRMRTKKKQFNAPFALLGIAVAVALSLLIWSVSLVWILDKDEPKNSHPHAFVDVTKSVRKTERIDPCLVEFDRVTQDQTPGLTNESLDRSRAWVGNQERLRNVAQTLKDESKSLNVVVFGGSISLGHGIRDPLKNGYSAQLESWMNKFYPLKKQKAHRVHNFGAHGADMCNLAKRLHIILEDLTRDGSPYPDLFILEFGINDYQGQDDVKQIEFKSDVFFNGFQDIALCGEAVVNKLLRVAPTTAVMFLEFRTAIPSRKTAQALHMGIASHYEVPVISHAEAMYPEYLHLLSLLNQSDSFSAPLPTRDNEATVLPYPYGCAACKTDDIGTHWVRCASVCRVMNQFGLAHCNETETPAGRQPCYVPMFAHDEVHPSRVGHDIAKDLIVHALSAASRDKCQNKPFFKHVIPTGGWLVSSPKELEARSNFVLVKDTMKVQEQHFDKLNAINYTDGWSYYSDTKGFKKLGWISTNTAGNEVIQFEIDLPQAKCYAIYLAILRSYDKMGSFTVKVVDLATQKVTSVDGDGLWKAHISVWSDIQVTQDDDAACTGKCIVSVQSHPQAAGRNGNKVKILTLSARECVSSQEKG